MSKLKPETLAVHAGYDPDPTTGSRAVPIYQTTSYVFENADHAADLFDLNAEGHIYSRISNPTSDALEKRMAALEGGVGALAVASGHAAEFLTIMTLMKTGDEFVAASTLYGGTYNMFAVTLPRAGITARFVDIGDLDQIRNAVNDKTKAIYLETIGNPRLNVPDFDAISQIARDAHVPMIVDNTVATPTLFRPFEHGANIVVHSATKYIGGHGTSIGGVIVDGGNFPWDSGRFPEFTEENPSYHGMRFFEKFGSSAFITKARVESLRDYGPSISPFNAFMFIQGIETLHLRMKQHSENALALAEWLANHPKVAWVNHPLLKGDPSYDLAQKYLPDGAGGLVAFGIKGGFDAGKKLINSVKLWSLLANIGDTRSLIIHPASTTHRQLGADELAAAGVGEDMIRLSVGIEHIDDIIEDLDQALSKTS